MKKLLPLILALAPLMAQANGLSSTPGLYFPDEVAQILANFEVAQDLEETPAIAIVNNRINFTDREIDELDTKRRAGQGDSAVIQTLEFANSTFTLRFNAKILASVEDGFPYFVVRESDCKIVGGGFDCASITPKLDGDSLLCSFDKMSFEFEPLKLTRKFKADQYSLKTKKVENQSDEISCAKADSVLEAKAGWSRSDYVSYRWDVFSELSSKLIKLNSQSVP